MGGRAPEVIRTHLEFLKLELGLGGTMFPGRKAAGRGRQIPCVQ